MTDWKNKIRHLGIAAALGLGVFLSACGGGGGGGGSLAEGGISGTGVSRGPISGFGSIFVGGIRHTLTGASILVNGVAVPETALELGMVVTVAGSINNATATGTATNVSYVQNLEGPVTSTDVPNSRLVVLGQNVLVDALTVFADVADLAALVPGNIVEVSGHIDDNGDIRATRIELEPPTASVELRGFITAVNGGAMTFNIGTQLVDYSGAAVLDVTGGVPAIGQYVEVEGTLPAATLLATSVEEEDEVPGLQIDDDAEITGVVTNFVSPADFSIGGVPARTVAGTTFEYGTAPDLANGILVEAEGFVAMDGVLEIDELTFLDAAGDTPSSGEFSLEADVDPGGVNVGAGELTVLGLVIKTDALTQFEDERDGAEPFGIAQILPGDRLDIEAFTVTSSGDRIAKKVKREAAAASVELEGTTTAVDGIGQTLTIAGIQVTTTVGTVYRDNVGTIIPAGTFFTMAQPPGGEVEVTGTWTGVSIQATELELE